MRCEEVSKCLKYVRKLQKCIAGFEGIHYIILTVQKSIAVCMLIAGNAELNTLLLPPACSLSHSGSFCWSFCWQHSYIHYIILMVQTSTAVCMLVAGNTGLNTLLLPLPTLSHMWGGWHHHLLANRYTSRLLIVLIVCLICYAAQYLL